MNMVNAIYQPLSNRSVLELRGKDSLAFLQGIITNDVKKLDEYGILYALVLTPKSRFLYDMFLVKCNDIMMLDCEREFAAEILKFLNMYKMRADVSLHLQDDISVFFASQSVDVAKGAVYGAFADPRCEDLGYRVYADADYGASLSRHGFALDNEFYVGRIFAHTVPEPHVDMLQHKSFPLEFGLQNFNAISFDKGCYIGQELISRTTYTGQLRKQLIKMPYQEGLTYGSVFELADGRSATFCSKHHKEMKVLVKE